MSARAVATSERRAVEKLARDLKYCAAVQPNGREANGGDQEAWPHRARRRD